MCNESGVDHACHSHTQLPPTALFLCHPQLPFPSASPSSCLLPQIFEVYGLGREVIDTAFCGSVSRIGGMSLADIQRETEAFWAKGFPDKVGVESRLGFAVVQSGAGLIECVVAVAGLRTA